MLLEAVFIVLVVLGGVLENADVKFTKIRFWYLKPHHCFNEP